ncbi:MAG: addiction module protein [Sulfuricella sp.]|nr:addiction module protein [Sulfuricella sp.]
MVERSPRKAQSRQRIAPDGKVVNIDAASSPSSLHHARGTISNQLYGGFTMGNQLELLEAEALKLTSGERAAFAQLLLASLDEDAEVEAAWAVETERRIADIENGAVQVIPIADALAQVRATLK